jgi:hypothetical protein
LPAREGVGSSSRTTLQRQKLRAGKTAFRFPSEAA